jgi:DnaJ domain
MFAQSQLTRFRFTRILLFETFAYRNVSSATFSKTLSVPFAVDKSKAEEAFKKYHSKYPLSTQPASPPPDPTPVYLPYYVIQATASLTYSARLGNTTHETRYNIFSRRWEYYPRTRHYDIPQQTLSSKEYPVTHAPLHVYAGYNQPPSWLELDTADILSLSRNHSLATISGITPHVEEFTRPIQGVQDQVLDYLTINEKERARKYLQRTYDPDEITFTSSVLHATVSHHRIYIPVWLFEFSYQGNTYSTYVAGWNGSTSGLLFFHPEWSGVLAGVSTLLIAPLLLGWKLATAAGVGGILGIGTVVLLRFLPSLFRMGANGEMEEIWQRDRKSVQQPSADDTQQQRQHRQRPQQQQREQTRAPPKYLANDPQGLYQTLEITPAASEAEVGQAFRRLAKKYHPDAVHGGDAEKDEAKRKFQQISEAYQVLRDPRRRREYDRYGTTSV